MSKYLKIKNWEKFQQCDRKAPWVKMYTSLIQDYEFLNQSDTEKAFFCCLILYCGQCGNKIPNDGKFLSAHFCLENQVDLQKLIDKGFLIELTENEHQKEQQFLDDNIENRKKKDRERYYKKKEKLEFLNQNQEFLNQKTGISERPETETYSKETEGVTSISPSKNTKTPSSPLPPVGVGVEKIENGKWSVLPLLSEKTISTARGNAEGWDIYYLIDIYNGGVNSGKREPPKDANKAFPVWCERYTKGIKL